MRQRFNEFMDNHWPHMERRVGRLEGEMYVVLAAMAAVITLLGVILTRIKYDLVYIRFRSWLDRSPRYVFNGQHPLPR